MSPWSLLLSILVLLAFFSTACCPISCNNQCCRFVEAFPARLKKLRENYSQIRDFYVSKGTTLTLKALGHAASFGYMWPCSPVSLQVMLHLLTSVCLPLLALSSSFFFCLQEANDDLDTALLDQSVEDSFKVSSSFNSTRSSFIVITNALLLKYNPKIQKKA